MSLSMRLHHWIDRTLAKREALLAETPEVSGRWSDDEGHPVSIREGRKWLRLPGESHEEAMERLIRNARTDLWHAGTADVLAEFLKDHVHPRGIDYPAAALAAVIGALGDAGQGIVCLGSAGAYRLKALYHKANAR